jgi:hypothetical protein
VFNVYIVIDSSSSRDFISKGDEAGDTHSEDEMKDLKGKGNIKSVMQTNAFIYILKY